MCHRRSESTQGNGSAFSAAHQSLVGTPVLRLLCQPLRMIRESSLRMSSPDTRERGTLNDDSPVDCTFVLTDRSVPFHATYDQFDLLQAPPLRKKHYQHGLHGVHGAHNSGRVLGTLSVVAITFFFGCGGPLGSETVISIAGPCVALIVIVVYPLVFTFPYGAVVAELCTAFPEDGGFPIAVRNAFGQFWGVQVGYWSWVGNIMSTAIYPAMLLDLVRLNSSMEIASPVIEYFLKAAIAVVLSIPTFFGTKLISRSMIGFLIGVLLIVTIYVVWAYIKAENYDQLGLVRRVDTKYNEDTGYVESSDGDVDIAWFDLLQTLFWNYDGVQMASVFGGQVLIPARVYPRAIFATVALTVLVYLLPLPATVATKYVDWTIFDDGSYGDVAVQIGGVLLKRLMILVNFATTMGMFVSSTYCEATEIAGMAQSGMLHPLLGKRNARFQSPHFSVLLTLLLTLVLLAFDTDFLIPVTNAFACLVAPIIFLAGVQLRRKFPHFPRPATVPGGPGVMLAIAVIPIAICGVIIYRTITESLSQFLTILGFVAIGLTYSAVERWREREEAQDVLQF